MKVSFFTVFLLLGGLTYSLAQPVDDIFSRKSKMVWLGLDFTAAKLVGDRDRWGSPRRTQHLIESINTLIVREQAKFNIASALRLRTIENQSQITQRHNQSLNLVKAVEDELNGHYLEPTDIKQVVQLYDFEGLTGTGVMFIVEALDKVDREARIWITFVDLETKEVVLTRRMIEEPSGFGVRNFWAGSIYKMLKQIRKKDYRLLKREYARKR